MYGRQTRNHPAAGHVIQLHDALRDVERMVIRQRNDTGGELDAFRPLARRGEEHFGGRDHFPAAGMMFAAPEFVIAKPIEMLDQIEVATKLQHRMLANRMMRGQKGTKIQTRHEAVSWMDSINGLQFNMNPAARQCEVGPDDQPVYAAGRDSEVKADAKD
jgi:hypothetical protein